MAKNPRFSAGDLPDKGRNFIVYSTTKSDNSDDNDSSFMPFMTGSDHVVSDVVSLVNWLCDTCHAKKTKIAQLNIYAHASGEAGGGIWLGSDYICSGNITGYMGMIKLLRPFFIRNGMVVLDSCAFGFRTDMLTKFSEAFGVPVRSYRDLQSPNWIRPRGEGPSIVCNATKCKKESKDAWFKDGKPIIDWHFAM
jgi:hypothetical protein